MRRRTFLAMAVPAAQRTAPLEEPHFPSPLHQFVWRNWELIETKRLAEVLKCGPAEVLAVGRSMGLPPKREPGPEVLRRGYVTVIRQNWHVLPESQLVRLLGWTPERFRFMLREDDFLDHKLGPKPECPELVYRPPTEEERRKAAWVRDTLRKELGADMDEAGEPRFAFIGDLSRPFNAAPPPRECKTWNPRFLYSFFALYGDPLIEPDLDPFPDGYLQRLAACGVNGVWMQAVLSTLAPSRLFPEFGEGWETRLRNLGSLVKRAARQGIKVYLYLNEPRAMPPDFFSSRPEMRGASHAGRHAICTSVPAVREWISGSLARVFKTVPGLGGVFCITMSENHTNCFSHGGGWGKGAPNAGDCPRCSRRTGWETIAEVIASFREGVRRSSASADIIAWDWGWGDLLAERLIPLLPKDVRFQSISEWEAPVRRGGVEARVGEYSISVPGPGPRATRNWGHARRAGLSTTAKVQFNNTWEISAVPYIPVPHLVLQHCRGLKEAGVSGVMLSWTCGGYPSPNLAAANAFCRNPERTDAEILTELAAARYGRETAAGAVEAWRIFSEAFQEFPYGVSIYLIPTQHGPANPLRLRPTGRPGSMILFPNDDLKRWCGAYPPQAVQSQFARLAARWKDGLDVFERALARASRKDDVATDRAVAETCYTHFSSVANQVEFCMLRETGDQSRLRQIAEAEIALAVRQYRVARRSSVIAYEASNHYYYTPLDLAEKILNCRTLFR